MKNYGGSSLILTSNFRKTIQPCLKKLKNQLGTCLCTVKQSENKKGVNIEGENAQKFFWSVVSESKKQNFGAAKKGFFTLYFWIQFEFSELKLINTPPKPWSPSCFRAHIWKKYYQNFKSTIQNKFNLPFKTNSTLSIFELDFKFWKIDSKLLLVIKWIQIHSMIVMHFNNKLYTAQENGEIIN